MATVSVTVTDAQATDLASVLRTNDDGSRETVAAYCQRILDNAAAVAASQTRQRNFDALNATQQTAAIASQS